IHGGRYAVGQAGVVEFVGGELGGGVFEFGGVDGAVGVAVEVAFASGANVCRTGSHRAVRRSGGAPTDEPVTTPYCRSTRPGCECVPGRFAPGAVLLQTSLPTSCCRSTRPGCECVPDRLAPRRCSYKQTLPQRFIRRGSRGRG